MAGDGSLEMRRLASECLALARQSSDPLVRFSRLDMAQKWIDFAELSEHDPWNDALRRRAIQAHRQTKEAATDMFDLQPPRLRAGRT
jgi:hypothetical protein